MLIRVLFLFLISGLIHMQEIPAQDGLQDPQFKNFIDNFSKHLAKLESLPLKDQRDLDRQFILAQNTNHQPVKRTENLFVESDDGYKIPVKISIPSDAKKLPLLLYFHGGGWVFGGIEESDAVCRRLANNLGCIVVSSAIA